MIGPEHRREVLTGRRTVPAGANHALGSEHRTWIRSARQGNHDLYRYVAACSCGWVGPVRDSQVEALPDMHEHSAEHRRRLVTS